MHVEGTEYGERDMLSRNLPRPHTKIIVIVDSLVLNFIVVTLEQKSSDIRAVQARFATSSPHSRPRGSRAPQTVPRHGLAVKNPYEVKSSRPAPCLHVDVFRNPIDCVGSIDAV